MSKIDISGWREFSIGELFNVQKGTRLTKQDMTAGTIRFIGASAVNNGITALIGNNTHLHPSNTITVSYNGSIGETFYQTEPFWASDDVNVLYPKFPMTKEIALFMLPIIKSVGKNYQFIDKWKKEDMESDVIKLPAMPRSGEPDYEYMENYIKQELAKVRLTLAELKSAKVRREKISCLNWREFSVGKLFKSIVKPDVLHTRQVRQSDVGIPYIVRSKFDNGIKFRVEKSPSMKVNPKGVITFGAENSSFFYQDEEFVSGRDIYYIDTREYSKECCIFLCAVLQTITEKYSYNYGLFPDLLKKESVKLPVDSSGNPDFAFMENYVRKMLAKQQKGLKAMYVVA